MIPKGRPTSSDETRARDRLLAMTVAAAALVASFGVSLPAVVSRGPLARPHVEAGLTCASCHIGAEPARAACTGCHAAAAHASTRAAHAELVARGALACTDCHPAHGDGAGITFEAGRRLRFRGDATRAEDGTFVGLDGVTVPLVDRAACARCHDLGAPRDPAARCFRSTAASEADVCFDEHPRRFDAAPRSAGVCAAQHVTARYAAWGAAAEAARTLAPPTPIAGGRALLLVGAVAVLGIAAPWVAGRTRRRKGANAPLLAPVVPAPVRRLPRIDPHTCLGCSACVDACPFEVLEVQKHVAVVARPDACCGVVLCASACPNGSLRIAEGAPVDDRPRIDAYLESLDAPGVFLAGDLTGLPLLKNAVLQGAQVVDRIAALRGTRSARTRIDLLVVGAGPAGLAALLRAKERGLHAVALEQSTLAASIRAFPRAKVVHDAPIDLPLEGELRLADATKEELIARWERIVRTHRLSVHEGHRATDVARATDGLVVTAATPAGGTARFVAARVLLAIGRRGTPRTLDATVAPGAETNVRYALADARAYAGSQVLVVGLGDAAMEAAIALARQPGTRVTVAHRGTGFTRGAARNVAELKALAARGDVDLRFETRLTEVGRSHACLVTAGRVTRIANDAVLVLVGGAPSWDLLARAGVRRAGEHEGARRENLSRRGP